MPLSLKVFTSTLLIGGDVGGIPLLLSSKNGIGGEAEKGVSAPINTGHEVTDTETEESRPETIEQANVGNCVIKKELEELENIIWTFEDSINIDTFVKVSCQDTNTVLGSPMANNWEGLFPNVLFKNLSSLIMGKKLKIKEVTESKQELGVYKTTFGGNSFYSPIVGEWTKETAEEKEPKITEVKITASGSVPSGVIYLLFKNQK
ncbi:hypothetical protein OVS_02120 [Mycoplasma ovis str. Michigan]|uniref:Uncharacterized protein n=1 Tax=Mycoplasma ovis str. Michigan TaxID=1415773 RepID=A0ABM5P1D1_9MOLU|nr:hypothetical protein [Mycoplasma ovis]AHC40286.1 hypothetical protein OVS_02120 [Mycoplasma ovis str. Michigan]